MEAAAAGRRCELTIAHAALRHLSSSSTPLDSQSPFVTPAATVATALLSRDGRCVRECAIGSPLGCRPGVGHASASFAESLPGSLFLGANGSQENAAPFVDWQALQAAGRVRHNPDPNDEDSAFKGGSKEDEPGQLGSDYREGRRQPRQGQHSRRVVGRRPTRCRHLPIPRLHARGRPGYDVPRVRAQPGRAAVEQRQGTRPLPAHR
jgi:hypothetical protein